MPVTLERMTNIGLRFSTLGVRFLLIFFLAKYLDAASVGYYGLFAATISYALYFVGLDYYIFVTREILATPVDQRGRMLKGQAALSAFLYLVFFPFMLAFLYHSSWPGHLVWWFLPILVLEHFNQEMSRLLVVLSEQITASIVLFVRQGSWVIAMVALMTWDMNARSLDMVMGLWACSGVAAAALAVRKLHRLKMGGWREPIDWIWIKRGVAVSAAFLLSTLALRGFQTIDRYWLEALGGIEVVGAYVLFSGIAGALTVFLDAGVFSFTYPALIGHHHRKEYDQARAKVRVMVWQTVAIASAYAVLSWLLLPYLLAWVGNSVYTNALSLYPWVMAAMMLNAIGLVPHFGLYARGQDKPIIYSHIAALPVFVLATWVASRFDRLTAVPIGLGAAFLLILVWKCYAYLKMNDDESLDAVSRAV